MSNYQAESEVILKDLVRKFKEGELDEMELMMMGRSLYDLGYSSGWETGDYYTKISRPGGF